MKPTCQFTQFIVALAALAAAGCTSIKSPIIGTYRNALFNKQFSELSISQTVTPQGTNIQVTLKGWRSDGTAIAEAVAHGLATGLKGAAGLPPVATLPPAPDSQSITLRQ